MSALRRQEVSASDRAAFAAVARDVCGAARLVDVRPLTGGVSSEVYALELEDLALRRTTVVLRRHRAQAWKPDPAAVVTREYRLLEVLHRAGLPVPEPISVDVEGSILAEPYLLIGFVDGTTELQGQTVEARVSTMAGALAELHALRFEALPELPTRSSPLPEVFEYLPAGEAEDRRLRDALAAHPLDGFEERPALLHGDFWPGNLLWRDGHLAAVIDWEDAAVGDPLSDLASAALEATYAYGSAAATAFVKAYRRRHPVPLRRFALWRIYVSAAGAHFMGEWGLAAEKEARMRLQAKAFLHEALADLSTPALGEQGQGVPGEGG